MARARETLNNGLCYVHPFWYLLSSCCSYATQRATLATGINEILHKVGLNHLVNQSQLYVCVFALKVLFLLKQIVVNF